MFLCAYHIYPLVQNLIFVLDLVTRLPAVSISSKLVLGYQEKVANQIGGSLVGYEKIMVFCFLSFCGCSSLSRTSSKLLN